MITSSKLRKIKIIQARDERHSATKFNMQLRTGGKMGRRAGVVGKEGGGERRKSKREREQAREIKEMVCRELVKVIQLTR